MKVGEIVYRKAPYRVTAVTTIAEGDGKGTHLALTPVETSQYVNCMDTDVEVPASEPAAAS